MTATQDRDLVCLLAPSDPVAALAAARRIESPWFRAQALAWVARFAHEDQVALLAAESLAASRLEADPYRVAGSMSWAIRALIERGCLAASRLAIADALAVLPDVSQPGSRAEACALLWHAAFPGEREARDSVQRAALQLCRAQEHWRAARLHQDIAATLASESPSLADAHIAAMPEGNARQRAQRERCAGVVRPPRPYFWT